MTVNTTKLNAIRGDTNTWVLIYPLVTDNVANILFTGKIGNKQIFQKSLLNGITATEDGITTTLNPIDTYSLEETLTPIRYDIQVTFIDNSVTTIDSGIIYVYPDVS